MERRSHACAGAHRSPVSVQATTGFTHRHTATHTHAHDAFADQMGVKMGVKRAHTRNAIDVYAYQAHNGCHGYEV